MKHRWILTAVVVIALAFGSVSASTLEERPFEWIFQASMVDQDDIGETTNVGFNYSYIFDGGYIGLGGRFAYAKVDFDDDLFEDADSYSIGPIFTYNWTPQYKPATGFLFASIRGVGGDASDFFRYATSFGVGVKGFVGNSAAIIAVYEIDKLTGKDDFDDLDQTALSVGLALYSGSR
jgi:hypothetical protein